MKTSIFKRSMALLLAVLLCFTTFISSAVTPVFAAGTVSEVCMIGFPRAGDELYSTGNWGHGALTFMNGWSDAPFNLTTVRTIGSYDGPVCYCLEPGVALNPGDRLTSRDESYWDNYPADYNNTISPDNIKLLVGRIMQYGYTGTVSIDWRTQNEGGDKLAHATATQLLIWETVVGERDADFKKVSTGGYDAVLDEISQDHPLRGKIMSYYNSIVSSVQSHTTLPSFLARSTGRAQNIELEWDGSQYTATLTDTNNVLSNYTFISDYSGLRFSVSGNRLTITADTAPTGSVTITATKNNSQRRGLIAWTDGHYGPNGSIQDLVTYTQSVTDPVVGYLNIKVSYGGVKIVKTSEDGKVSGITFTVTGNGVNQTVQTNSAGEIQLDNLTPGSYTVTEHTEDRYEPQQSRTVTVVSGQTATVTFSNTL